MTRLPSATLFSHAGSRTRGSPMQVLTICNRIKCACEFPHCPIIPPPPVLLKLGGGVGMRRGQRASASRPGAAGQPAAVRIAPLT